MDEDLENFFTQPGAISHFTDSLLTQAPIQVEHKEDVAELPNNEAIAPPAGLASSGCGRPFDSLGRWYCLSNDFYYLQGPGTQIQ